MVDGNRLNYIKRTTNCVWSIPFYIFIVSYKKKDLYGVFFVYDSLRFFNSGRSAYSPSSIDDFNGCSVYRVLCSIKITRTAPNASKLLVCIKYKVLHFFTACKTFAIKKSSFTILVYTELNFNTVIWPQD